MLFDFLSPVRSGKSRTVSNFFSSDFSHATFVVCVYSSRKLNSPGSYVIRFREFSKSQVGDNFKIIIRKRNITKIVAVGPITVTVKRLC